MTRTACSSAVRRPRRARRRAIAFDLVGFFVTLALMAALFVPLQYAMGFFQSWATSYTYDSNVLTVLATGWLWFPLGVFISAAVGVIMAAQKQRRNAE